jgi:RNA polymerase sigma-70 factor (ECF subfamily)
VDELNADARATADAVARRSYGKLVAVLAARTRDVAGADDALSDAFATALADWPQSGCPVNPEAWLLTVARRRLIDGARKRRNGESVADQLLVLTDEFVAHAGDAPVIPDQRLGLLFACAHPAIDAGIRAPLILQGVLGLDAATIASAFLLPPATMGQRLVRAKTKIRQAGIPFRIPAREELSERLAAVLEAIYAVYSEGWADAAGTDVARRDLAEEAIYLGHLVTELLPGEPEALGLLALMLYTEARRRARRDAAGEYVPLASQDTSLWDARMIEHAEALLRDASARECFGRYQLEAALQSAHIHRRLSGVANWQHVVRLYDALLEISNSPVVAINRALAMAELQGPPAALSALEAVAADPRLVEYQPYWAARAALWVKAGAGPEARHAYGVAIGLERDPAVRRFLQEQLSSVPGERTSDTARNTK